MSQRRRKNGDRQRWSMLRLCVFIGLGMAVPATGCRSTKSSALVEAELRTRDREVRQLQTDLKRSETMNHAMVRELTDRRQSTASPCPPSSAVIDGPAAVMSGMVKEIILGRGTGGLDDDGWPGDEALQVIVVPQDIDGHAVKVPGTVSVLAFEVTSDGLKIPLDRWEVAPLQVQRSWRSGLFSTGYFIKLPWRKWPASEKLRIVAQFTTVADGRVLEADRDIKIRLMPGGPRGVPAGGLQIIPPPATFDAPALPPVGGSPGRDVLPTPLEGPLLPPGAWMRETGPAARIEAAKPAPIQPSSAGATLMGPRPRQDVIPDEP